MVGRLTGTVVLRHPDTDEVTVLLAGDEVPEWAADRITSPGLVEQGTPADQAAEPSVSQPVKPRRRAAK